MISKEYIRQIIKAIDTKKSRTEGTSGNKKFVPSQADIDQYGLETIVETVRYLEKCLPAGSVIVKWDKLSYHHDIEYFAVSKEAIEELYTLVGEVSSRSKLKEAQNVILRLRDQSAVSWLKTGYYEELLKKISRGTIPKIDITLDMVLNKVCANTEPVYLRIFSVNTLGDSKAFEKIYRGDVCNIIRKYCPQDFEDCSDNDVLRFFNILSYNAVFEFKGPFTWFLNTDPNVQFSSVGQCYGTILNTDTMLHMTIRAIPEVKQVITVENKANFYAAPYQSDTLYIYAHGFFSPIEVGLCRQINQLAESGSISFFHWGDLDYGGIKIYEYIKRHAFPALHPLHMDKAAYLRYRECAAGYSIKSETLKKLSNIDVPELNELRDLLLSTGIAYEQESIIIW